MKTPAMLGIVFTLTCAALAGFTPLAARAAPGDFDTTFGSDGNGANVSKFSSLHGVAIQPDGKIVIGGSFNSVSDNSGTYSRNHIARLNADGSVDASFGSEGSGTEGSIDCVVIQPDGKIVIGGTIDSISDASGTLDRFGIARLNADGSIDASFGSDGSGASGTVYSAALQPDGKIVIAGSFNSVYDASNTYSRRKIARLNADGSVDTSFGSDGNGADKTVYSAALQPDGKIVIAGYFTSISDASGTHNRNYIARLNADGSIDPSFGSDGNGADKTVYGVALQPDGKIVIAGNFTSISDASGTHSRNYIARLNADGSIDPSFGSDGNGASSTVFGATLQPDGKVVIAGRFTSVSDASGTHSRNYIARLNADGSIDTSFGSDGNGAGDYVYGAALQPDGKVVIAGSFTSVSDASGTQSRNYIARLENGAATSSLTIPSLSEVKWLRGGTAPEATRVTFESSTDGGATYLPLGDGSRISGGWQITGVSISAKAKIRSRAFTAGGFYNASSGIVEAFVSTPAAAYYDQANFYYQYFTAQGDANTGLAYWFYFRAYGDQAYYNAIGNSAYAQFKFYEGLAYFYYTYFKYSAPNLSAYFLYLNFAYAYLDYLTLSSDPAGAISLYNHYYALALSVL